ncbi:MAG: molybdopterin converting factor subunit 1 [Verrucomicrobiota bacterium]|jgi:molybdopterin synthase sulfur carrier subunit
MQFKLLYFAILSQDAGRSSETFDSSAASPAALYEELRVKRQLRPRSPAWRVAVNDSFAPWDSLLKDGDSIAFIPPVSGG